MDLKRIVIATDFSEVSLLAVETGAQLARESCAELVLVHVMEFPRGADVAAETLYGSVEEQYRQQLHRLQMWLPENLRDKTVAERTILRGSGTPARQIADFAQKKDADLIVVGTHGRKGLGRLVMGSTAEGLLRWAPCQVLVVKPKVAAERASLGTDPVEVSEDNRTWELRT